MFSIKYNAATKKHIVEKSPYQTFHIDMKKRQIGKFFLNPSCRYSYPEGFSDKQLEWNYVHFTGFQFSLLSTSEAIGIFFRYNLIESEFEITPILIQNGEPIEVKNKHILKAKTFENIYYSIDFNQERNIVEVKLTNQATGQSIGFVENMNNFGVLGYAKRIKTFTHDHFPNEYKIDYFYV